MKFVTDLEPLGVFVKACAVSAEFAEHPDINEVGDFSSTYSSSRFLRKVSSWQRTPIFSVE